MVKMKKIRKNKFLRVFALRNFLYNLWYNKAIGGVLLWQRKDKSLRVIQKKLKQRF